MKKEILWTENGWTVLQDADAETHTLEISCYAANGTVTELRKRHNDGEEEKLTKQLPAGLELPMPLADFKKAYAKGKINLK